MTQFNLPLPRRLHFIGIGGAGMSALAELLLVSGYQISGSDIVRGEVTQQLKQMGATIILGHAAPNIGQAACVIYSSAIAEDNPELLAAKSQGIVCWHRSQLLSALVERYSGVVVIGSHGKSTTAWLIAAILSHAGLAPAFAIGAKLQQPLAVRNLSISTQRALEYFIAEGDESDGSFSTLKAKLVVVTNIDNDHLAHYNGELDQLRAHFLDFLQQLPAQATVILGYDDPFLKQVAKVLRCSVITYGFNDQATFVANDMDQQGLLTHFTLKQASDIQAMQLNRLPGRHNVLNALAAIAVAQTLGIERSIIHDALQQFVGVQRRLQYLSPPKKLKGRGEVVVDYGHHPNEIQSAIEAVKASWKGRRIVMVFQPHRFSRTHALFEEFIRVLTAIDQLYLLPLYSAGESPIDGASSADLYERLAPSMGERVRLLAAASECLSNLYENLGENDVVLLQGAGQAIDQLADDWFCSLPTTNG